MSFLLAEGTQQNLKSVFIQSPQSTFLKRPSRWVLGQSRGSSQAGGRLQPEPPVFSVSRFIMVSFLLALSLFPDKPLQKKSAGKQLERVPSAGGVWQAGSQIQPPPNHSGSHLNEGKERCNRKWPWRPRFRVEVTEEQTRKPRRRGSRYHRAQTLHLGIRCPFSAKENFPLSFIY